MNITLSFVSSFLAQLFQIGFLFVLGWGSVRFDQPDGFSWYVGTNGKNSNSCKSPSQSCLTIQGALDKASSGDEIYVTAGVYKQNSDPMVMITKGISISGGWDQNFTQQTGNTIVDGENIRKIIMVDTYTTVTLEDLTIQNGYSDSNGGGIYAKVVENLYLKRLVIKDNRAESSGGGVYANGVQSIIEDSLIENNFAYLDGGGIFSHYDTDLLLEYSTIRGNFSNFDGGGIKGAHKITSCLIEDNSAGEEGGGVSGGTQEVIIEDTTFHSNRASAGGGIYANSINLLNSTFSRNYAIDEGGAIYVSNSLKILNSTLSENVAFKVGGGIMGSPSIMEIRNGTILGNIALKTGGAFYNNGITNLRNSIIFNNSANTSPDCMGIFQSYGYNLIGDLLGCDFKSDSGDLIGVDPLISVQFGAPTIYYLLSPDSPAMDGGNPDGCLDQSGNVLVFDQGWNGRPKDGNGDGVAVCDMGSSEYNPAKPPQIIYIPFIGKQTDYIVDQFDTPFSGWPIVDNSDVYIAYTTRETYTLQVKQSGMYTFVKSPFGSFDHYTVEVDGQGSLKLNGDIGASYGLVFGIDSAFENYFVFDINTETQQYELYRVTPLGAEFIVQPTKTTSIRYLDETNHLKATIGGTKITLEVNNRVLGSWEDQSLVGLTGTGLASGSFGGMSFTRIDFDNFNLRLNQPLSNSNLITQNPQVMSSKYDTQVKVTQPDTGGNWWYR